MCGHDRSRSEIQRLSEVQSKFPPGHLLIDWKHKKRLRFSIIVYVKYCHEKLQACRIILIDSNQYRVIGLPNSKKGCSHSLWSRVEMAARELTCTGNVVTELGVSLLFLVPFTLPSSKESRIPIFWLVNAGSLQSILSTCFEYGTFRVSGKRSNHSATAPA